MHNLTAWLAENMAILIIVVGQMLFIAFVGYMIKRKLAQLEEMEAVHEAYYRGYKMGVDERITALESRASDTNDRLAGISSFSGYDEFRND